MMLDICLQSNFSLKGRLGGEEKREARGEESALRFSATQMGGAQALLDDAQKMVVFEGSSDAFLIIQLLIHRVLRLVRPLFDLDVNLESVRQGSQQANSQGQTDESGHRAVRNRGSEADKDVGTVGTIGVVGRVRDGDLVRRDDGESFEGERMFRVGDGANEVKYLLCVDPLFVLL